MVGFLTIYFQYYDFPAISPTVIHFRFLGRRRNVAFAMYFCTPTSVTLHPFQIADILIFFLRLQNSPENDDKKVLSTFKSL